MHFYCCLSIWIKHERKKNFFFFTLPMQRLFYYFQILFISRFLGQENVTLGSLIVLFFSQSLQKYFFWKIVWNLHWYKVTSFSLFPLPILGMRLFNKNCTQDPLELLLPRQLFPQRKGNDHTVLRRIPAFGRDNKTDYWGNSE